MKLFARYLYMDDVGRMVLEPPPDESHNTRLMLRSLKWNKPTFIVNTKWLKKQGADDEYFAKFKQKWIFLDVAKLTYKGKTYLSVRSISSL